ncbi:MAG: CoB--CoM heterodisulfide reductase iron-sulfur subunit A family protein, partial [Delftia sp.]|nr:CoB--CoM heterodisulfide reductase iron-sulfur subunit A family protein [Delftia sp.]
MANEARIGLFVCDCGDQISSILNTEALVESAAALPGVGYATHAPYWCSAGGRERMQAAIQAQKLDRVVVAGCSPRTHRPLFQETVAQTGLNPGLFSLLNIREGCAWPHRTEPDQANTRARDQIGMEIAHLFAMTPRPPTQADITPAGLVIGGGVAGMTAALELAEAGIPVTLVERAATLGGAALTGAPALAANLAEAVKTQPAINLHLDSRVTGVDGAVGAYHLTITQNSERSIQHGPFGAIIVATGVPNENTGELAGLLRLTQDTHGFLPELRVRLRPQ